MVLRRLVPTVLAVIAGGLYATLTLQRFTHFAVVSWDNAIFEQAVKAYAHGRPPVSDVKGPGFNLLGDHFSPILAMLAPIYRIFPFAQTLLLAQCALIAVSIWVIGRLAIEKLNTLPGVLVTLCYSLSFGLQSAVYADFHEIAFAVPCLALAGAAYVRGNSGTVVVWAMPLLLVKEDMGITVAAIGVVLVLAGFRRRGLTLAVTGIAAAAVIIWLIVPAVNPESHYDYTSKVAGGIFHVLAQEPGVKIATLAITVAVSGFIAARSPWLLVAIPTLLWRFIGDNPAYWGIDYHYSAHLMPIVFIAMIDAMSKEPRHRWYAWWVRLAPGIALGLVLAMATYAPLWDLSQPSSWQTNSRQSAAQEIIEQIPDDASVETDIGVITHLVTDHDVYWIGSIGKAQPDYVLLETGNYGSPDDAVEYASDKHGGRWRLRYAAGPFQLAAPGEDANS